MSFMTACSCGARFQVRQELMGTQVICPTCGKRFAATHTAASGDAKSQEPSIKVPCRCGRTLRVAAKYFGKQIKCPACGAALAVPPGRS